MSISVVIPTYNRGPKIGATLESVLAQTLAPLEIIVVDDGSTDDTADWIEAHYGARVTLIRQPNGGVARARNRGLEAARGEFIAFLDHDDLWLPQKLEWQRQAMEKDARIGVVHCDWRAVNESGEILPLAEQMTQQNAWRPPPARAYPWVWMPFPVTILRNPIHSMTFPLIRTQLVRDIGGFDATIVPSDDWDLWIRLARITRFGYVPNLAAYYVNHDAQQHSNMLVAASSQLVLCAKHPINVRRYPLLWLRQQFFRRCCRDYVAYAKAKNALFANHRFGAFARWFSMGLLRPEAALSKRWIYLLWRVARGNSEVF